MTQTTFVRNANGSYTSSTSTPTATLSLVIAKHSEITKSGVALSGTWTMTFADPANNRNGSLSATAYMAQDCTLGANVKICTESYTTRDIRDMLLMSSRACSSFYPAGSFSAGGNTITLPYLQNEFRESNLDPTCTGAYTRLAGTFAVTKQ